MGFFVGTQEGAIVDTIVGNATVGTAEVIIVGGTTVGTNVVGITVGFFVGIHEGRFVGITEDNTSSGDAVGDSVANTRPKSVKMIRILNHEFGNPIKAIII